MEVVWMEVSLKKKEEHAAAAAAAAYATSAYYIRWKTCEKYYLGCYIFLHFQLFSFV